jgi:hypothetical protein
VADVRLTPEWMKEQARMHLRWAATDGTEHLSESEIRLALMRAQALTLAALALRRHEAWEAAQNCMCEGGLCAHDRAFEDIEATTRAYCNEITRPSAAEEER